MALGTDLVEARERAYDGVELVQLEGSQFRTDIKPLEIVMFMRAVRSRNFFEQMKGRGVRTVDLTELRSVTPDADGKDRFVLIDCVGVLEQDLSETAPLEKKPGVALEKILNAVGAGSVEVDLISTRGSIAGSARRREPRSRSSLEDASSPSSLEISCTPSTPTCTSSERGSSRRAQTRRPPSSPRPRPRCCARP